MDYNEELCGTHARQTTRKDCRGEPGRVVDGTRGVVAAGARIPKIPKTAHDEGAEAEEGEEDVHVRALLEVAPLEGGGKHFDREFVGDEPVAPPSWDWIHLRGRLPHLPHAIFQNPCSCSIDWLVGVSREWRCPPCPRGLGSPVASLPLRPMASCLTYKNTIIPNKSISVP